MFENARGDILDRLFTAARSGDTDAFARWMSLVEIPLRRALSRFSRHVDVEVVVQETLLRMWILANDPDRQLEGENAPIRFANVVARNVAEEELRRSRPTLAVEVDHLDVLPEGRIDPILPDPALKKRIRESIERLPGKLRSAILARIREIHLPDKHLAEALRIKLNTFLQSVVRARRSVRECLARKGVRLEEVL